MYQLESIPFPKKKQNYLFRLCGLFQFILLISLLLNIELANVHANKKICSRKKNNLKQKQNNHKTYILWAISRLKLIFHLFLSIFYTRRGLLDKFLISSKWTQKNKHNP